MRQLISTYERRRWLCNVQISDFLYLALFNLLLFESTLQQDAAIVSYVDEFFTIFILFKAVLKLSKSGSGKAKSPVKKTTIVALFAFLMLGFVGSLTHGVQAKIFPVLIDFITCAKCFVTLFCVLYVVRDRADLLRLITMEAKILALIMILCASVNLVVDFGMGYDTRYGLRSFAFITPHPEEVNLMIVSLVIILGSRIESNRLWIVILLIVMVLSLRSKAIAFVPLCLVLLVLLKGDGRIKKTYIFIGIAAMIYLGWDQFQYYYTTEGSARAALTMVSTQVANAYFPFGSGYASFGSNITATPEYYSSLYYSYGLSEVFGLQPGNVAFLSDTFWPTVIAQFGWAGLSAFICLIALASRDMFTNAGGSGQKFSTIVFWGYLLVLSTSGSSFFNPASVCMAFAVALVVGNQVTEHEG